MQNNSNASKIKEISMHQPFSGFISIIAPVAIALLSIFATPSALAHAGHHDHEHAAINATGGDFTLTSAKGPVSLADFRGKLVAIYFGYTHCADICPVDLSKLGKALKSMRAEEVAQIQPVFITLDPARDDAKQMAIYSASFHPRLIGLTGPEAEIAVVAKAYGVNYEKGPVNAAGGYDIDHPSVIYLVGRRGELLHNLPQDSSSARIAAALRKALK
jgi:protein SCO1/2